MTNPEPYRVAVYLTPNPGLGDERAWSFAGGQWLGRDAATGQECTQVQVPGIATDLFAALTAAPRRYGWHATLKAPFELAPGVGLQRFEEAVASLARSFPAFQLPPLQVADLGSFMALCPARSCGALQALASACVTQLHPLAQALSPEAMARRMRERLSPRQRELLVQWGYPWVLEEFRFHCTLTGDLAEVAGVQRRAIERTARAHFDSLPPPTASGLAVFVEPRAGDNFLLHSHWPLGPAESA